MLAILATQQHNDQKEMECLVGKLRSTHLTVPGAVEQLYHIQSALAQEGEDRSWILSYFHREIDD